MLSEKANSHEANVITITKWISAAMAGTLLLSAGCIFAQNQAAAGRQNAAFMEAYDIGREQAFVGTVLSYTEASQKAPFGPRLSLQTASGVLDIHLGDARTLAQNHFTIQTGDSLRVLGENVRFPNQATQFLARILQKGNQAIAVRTPHGFPIPPTTSGNANDASPKRGAM